MNFLKKLINLTSSSEEKEIRKQQVHLSLDDAFVHNFIKKGGKFLYCTKLDEVVKNVKEIIIENNWTDLIVFDHNLSKLIQKEKITQHKNHHSIFPFFTTCEHLIAENGDVLFSSNQLGSAKLSELSKDFIVYATTSQIVKNTGEGLTGIKTNFKENIPTNISSVRNYNLDDEDDNLLNFGNNNSKNLYLLLFENL
ncbi:MAG: LUD domain-containing protein [Polaribacter sp.]